MKVFIRLIALMMMALIFCEVPRAKGAATGFVNNPTGNSGDWSAAVTTLGGIVNTDVNFDTHPLGNLQPNFYLASDGVTLSSSGAPPFTVVFGSGPGQGNGSTGPLSPGEGIHPVSNYLFDDAARSATLTVSFNAPVWGAGLYVIDYFDPNDGNPIYLEAFSGPNGSGTSLGLFQAAEYNFQQNYLYFMGVASADANIRSIVFYAPGFVGDQIGLDNIVFASVPEPSIKNFSALALIGITAVRRFRAYR